MDNFPSGDCRTGRYSAMLIVNKIAEGMGLGHADVLVVDRTVLVESGSPR